MTFRTTNPLPTHLTNFVVTLTPTPQKFLLDPLNFLYDTLWKKIFLKKRHEKRGREVKTKFMRHALLAKDNALCFQEANFIWNLSMTLLQVCSRVGLAPIGIPK